LKKIRVFVTGGAGVIGMEMIPRLVSMGADVLVGDLKQQPVSFRGAIRYWRGDINDMSYEEFAAFNPEIIIHLAATFERSTETLKFWEENFHNNIKLSHHLMSMARRCKQLRRIIFASSYLIYEPKLYQYKTAQAIPFSLSEDDPIRPRNLIGMAKLAHEQELQFLNNFAENEFSTLCVRIFRGYGKGSRDIISRWVRSLIRGHEISVYSPEGLFDYIYAADSAEGLIRLAMSYDATGIVNLGTGCSRSVADVVNILKSYFPLAKVNYEASDIDFEASQANTKKLESLIYWKPTKRLEETIPEIIAYEKTEEHRSRTVKISPTPPYSVLLTSAARKIPLFRSLKKAAERLHPSAKVVAGDIDDMAATRLEADVFWKMPPLSDDALDPLIQGCLARNITVILPTRDGELDFWARNRHAFAKAGIKVIVSSEPAITRCRDKLAFGRFGSEAALPIIPAGTSPDAFGSVPLVVKERYGAGSRGIGLQLMPPAAREHARKLTEPIFQPFVSGPEISIDGWVSERGDVAGVVLRRRDRVVAGESQVTTTFQDVALETQALQALRALELRGPVVLQAIVEEAGALQIIECNPRFGGASTASIAVGLDSLYWSLSEAWGKLDAPIFYRSTNEVRQVRAPQDYLIYGTDF
jgi:carbamoyl-phosphate synthase large subunit